MDGLDAAIRAKLAARPIARNLHTDDDRARANAWMIRAQNALATVLDRHKPNPVLNGLGPYCEVCVGGYEGVSEWPCETVLGVAKALGIEVAGG